MNGVEHEDWAEVALAAEGRRDAKFGQKVRVASAGLVLLSSVVGPLVRSLERPQGVRLPAMADLDLQQTMAVQEQE